MPFKLICPTCGSVGTVHETTVSTQKLIMDEKGSILTVDEPEIKDSKTLWECTSCENEVDPEDTKRASNPFLWIVESNEIRCDANPTPICGYDDTSSRVFRMESDARAHMCAANPRFRAGLHLTKVRLVRT